MDNFIERLVTIHLLKNRVENAGAEFKNKRKF